MRTLAEYARQSAFTDPGPYADRLDALPADVRELAAVVRNVVVHYRASGRTFPPERLAEIDHRWVDRMLASDQGRFDAALAHPRPEADRVVGCCRDFTALTVAALRHRGVPARSRIGFAAYFDPDLHGDHVIAEYWNGARWVFVDAELEPGFTDRFDPADLPLVVGSGAGPTPPHFATAAQVWTAYRRDEIDVRRYGVGSEPHLRGAWFVRNYVLLELAHRRGDELLLWDLWGAMSWALGGDLAVVDDVAALLLAADDGDEAAERRLAERYAADPALHPGGSVHCASPTGHLRDVDLRTRTDVGVVPTPAVTGTSLL